MRTSSEHEISLRNMAIRILNTRFIGSDDRIRFFSDNGVEITAFPIGNGRGLTINHRRPDARARLVFVLHHRKNEPAQTLLFVAGPWEESLRQLAAETRPRRVEPAR